MRRGSSAGSRRVRSRLATQALVVPGSAAIELSTSGTGLFSPFSWWKSWAPRRFLSFVFTFLRPDHALPFRRALFTDDRHARGPAAARRARHPRPAGGPQRTVGGAETQVVERGRELGGGIQQVVFRRDRFERTFFAAHFSLDRAQGRWARDFMFDLVPVLKPHRTRTGGLQRGPCSTPGGLRERNGSRTSEAPFQCSMKTPTCGAGSGSPPNQQLLGELQPARRA